MSAPYSLGRLVEHDEASRSFPAATIDLRSVLWAHHGPVLDQGQLGSCTGNAMAQCLNTDPFRAELEQNAVDLLVEQDALELYSWATHHDRFPGVYPPDDTGSSGLAAAKAARHGAYISGYHHAFGLAHTLGALSRGPVIIGIPWTEAMFTPDADGFVHPDGDIAGGHEVCLLGLDADARYVVALNSWGESWGLGGSFRLTWEDLGDLLRQDGDCTVPVL